MPGKILSGGDMSIVADVVNNDKSHMIAGGSLVGTIGALNNTEVKGERVTTDKGVVTRYWRTSGLLFGHNSHTQTTYYEPSAEIETISVIKGEISEGEVTLEVPDSGLFGEVSDPTMHYVIETDPNFTNHQQWLSSDYFLRGLGLEVNTSLKRLGDGFYEQQLIKEQVMQLTGRRFMGDYEDNETQYQALMDNGIAYAQTMHLSPGVSLSAEQLSALTTNMVWLVEKEVQLPNGAKAKVLVPQLYVVAQVGNVSGNGALISGDTLNLQLSGDAMSSGSISGHRGLNITAENVNNIGGKLVGQDIRVEARADLNNLGAQMAASNTLFVRAGGDIQLKASTVMNAGLGETTLVAGNDMNLSTVSAIRSEAVVWDDENYQKRSSFVETGSTIQAQGDLTLEAGHHLNIKAGQLRSDQGNIVGNDINLSAGEKRSSSEQGHKKENKGFFSKKTIKTEKKQAFTTAEGTNIDSLKGEVAITAGGNYSQTGGAVVAQGNIEIEAGRIDISEAMESSSQETRLKKQMKRP
jgi:filamentous hemagglutinin